jgi:hypothetical protein
MRHCNYAILTGIIRLRVPPIGSCPDRPVGMTRSSARSECPCCQGVVALLDNRDEDGGQGLTLVHIIAQPESFMSPKAAKHPIAWVKRCSH